MGDICGIKNAETTTKYLILLHEIIISRIRNLLKGISNGSRR